MKDYVFDIEFQNQSIEMVKMQNITSMGTQLGITHLLWYPANGSRNRLHIYQILTELAAIW